MSPRGPGKSKYICLRSKHSGPPGARLGIGAGTMIIWGHWPECPKGRPGEDSLFHLEVADKRMDAISFIWPGSCPP